MYLENDENTNLSINKYEAMLKSNKVLFFDSNEFENIIHHYLDEGQLSKAKKAITLGLSQHPSSINLKLFEVEILVFENKLDAAEDILNNLQEIEPKNDEIYIQKASIFSKKNEHKKSILLLNTALKLTQDKADVHSLLGMEYLFMDSFEDAKHHFTECLYLDPDDYSALYNVINCYNFLEQTDDAIEFLSEYLDVNPYCEIAWHQLGKQYIVKKELKKALAAFDFAIISEDTFVGAYIEKGKILEKLNRYEDAIENYTITLGLEDPTSYALLHIGKCYEKLNQPKEALEYYQKTVHEDPLLDKGWLTITEFYLKQKNYQKALYYINKAIDIDTENVNYWKHYAYLNQKVSKFEEAEIGYRKALELGDIDLNLWLNRSDVLYKLGENDAALISLDQAAELYPESAEVNFRISAINFLNNDISNGVLFLNKAFQQEPEFFLIIEELFPKLLNMPEVMEISRKYINL